MDELTLMEYLISPARNGVLVVDFNGTPIPPVFDLNDIYSYDKATGTWKVIDNLTAKGHVQDVIRQRNAASMAAGNNMLRIEGTAYKVNGVVTSMQAALWRSNPGFFNKCAKGLAFKNGFLKFNDQNVAELRAHAPEHGARFVAPYNYEDIPTPNWDVMLEAVFGGNPDAEEKKVLLYEFIGAALTGLATRFGRCMIFLGEGSNGKTTIQTVVRAMFPMDLVCTSNPQTWHREYDRAELSGKRINITGELPEKEMLESEAFKTIVEGGTITARIIRQAPFQFQPEAAHLFSSNSMLKTNDYSHGFFRRFIMLPFTNKFTPTTKDITADIIASELGGIAYKAVKALEKALDRKTYTLPPSVIETLADWKTQANPVASFAEACLFKEEADPANFAKPETPIKIAELWEAWKNWADTYKFNALNLTTFGRRLKQVVGADRFVHLKTGSAYFVALNVSGLEFARGPQLLP